MPSNAMIGQTREEAAQLRQEMVGLVAMGSKMDASNDNAAVRALAKDVRKDNPHLSRADCRSAARAMTSLVQQHMPLEEWRDPNPHGLTPQQQMGQISGPVMGLDAETEAITMECPSGASAGTLVSLQLSGGDKMPLVIPDGVKAFDVFTISKKDRERGVKKYKDGLRKMLERQRSGAPSRTTSRWDPTAKDNGAEPKPEGPVPGWRPGAPGEPDFGKGWEGMNPWRTMAGLEADEKAAAERAANGVGVSGVDFLAAEPEPESEPEPAPARPVKQLTAAQTEAKRRRKKKKRQRQKAKKQASQPVEDPVAEEDTTGRQEDPPDAEGGGGSGGGGGGGPGGVLVGIDPRTNEVVLGTLLGSDSDKGGEKGGRKKKKNKNKKGAKGDNGGGGGNGGQGKRVLPELETPDPPELEPPDEEEEAEEQDDDNDAEGQEGGPDATADAMDASIDMMARLTSEQRAELLAVCTDAEREALQALQERAQRLASSGTGGAQAGGDDGDDGIPDCGMFC